MTKKKEQKHDVIVYRGTSVPAIDVMVDGETVWLSIDQMAKLFGRDKSVIGKHVRAVFREGEAVKESVWAKFAYTARDGKTYQIEDPEPFLSKDRKMIGFSVE